MQNDLGSVLVSWTAPSAPPFGGYQVTAEPGGVSETALTSPHSLINLQPGVYTIQLITFSLHCRQEALQRNIITVRGETTT